MAEPKKYATAMDFRRALETRLGSIAERDNFTIERLRREVSFDRLLARLFASDKAPWVLKGGYALELRMKEARVTKDIDLVLRETLGKGETLHEALYAALKAAAAVDLGDFFVFVVGPVMMDLEAGGARFPIEARMADRTFMEFHIDIGAGDVLMAPLDVIEGHDWLKFAGIAAPRVPTISREQHFAEKLHAYTVPRKTPNTRVRDLVDMDLLIKTGALDKPRVAEAIKITFERRKTPVPSALEAPPPAWEEPFAKLARQSGLSEEIGKSFSVLVDFFEGIQTDG
ncbi:MAG: nucleotidyl transferase AbiEii/AbiGii toxin family protein [Elusimicrobia bacterium]|nr:nucleotidyl transferase AbiEii/AbiGii toxin family protein [Elusimicrobiota bacterium]